MDKTVGLFDINYIFNLIIMGEIRLAKEKIDLEDMRGDRLKAANAKYCEGVRRIDGLRLHLRRLSRPKVIPLYRENRL